MVKYEDEVPGGPNMPEIDQHPIVEIQIEQQRPSYTECVSVLQSPVESSRNPNPSQ